jgi:hypothetical protein
MSLPLSFIFESRSCARTPVLPVEAATVWPERPASEATAAIVVAMKSLRVFIEAHFSVGDLLKRLTRRAATPEPTHQDGKDCCKVATKTIAATSAAVFAVVRVIVSSLSHHL